MGKFFTEKQISKISLKEYWLKIEKEYLDLKELIEKYSTSGYATTKEIEKIAKLKSKKRELSLQYAQIRQIYSSLGDIEIKEDMIDTLRETFDSSKCRYGTICLKKETIQSIYEISELFPELSKDALLSISSIYIKDLFDKYSLIETLAIMIRKEGMEDKTFEEFMDKTTKLADQEDKKYDEVAWYIRIHCGEYPYDFVRSFEKFVKEHHISWEKFYKSLPSPELILKDQMELKELSLRTKECWSICQPITFQMLEDYLDGDTLLSEFEEQPAYYVSPYIGKQPTSFTKTDFLESIKEKQKQLKK